MPGHRAALAVTAFVAVGIAAIGGAPRQAGAAPSKAGPRNATAAAPAHHMTIAIRGPLAHVTAVRDLPPLPPGREFIFDLALPTGATLLDLSVGPASAGAGARKNATPLATTLPLDANRARDAYLASLRSRSLEAAAESWDEGTSHRLRLITPVAQAESGPALVIRYSYVARMRARANQLVLEVPRAADVEPVGADVRVEVVSPARVGLLAVDVAGVNVHPPRPQQRVVVSAQAPTRAAWTVTVTHDGGPAPTAPAARAVPRQPILTAMVAQPDRRVVAEAGAAPPSAPAVVLAAGVAEAARPERLLLLVDRSRSVGAAGLAAERDGARRILEALPHGSRFAPLLFERKTERLFPAPRTVTGDALRALDDALVPATLANGTDPASALAAAGQWLRSDADLWGPRTLLVILTDGAFGPGGDGGPASAAASGAGPGGEPDGETLARALGPLPAGVDVDLLAVAVRPDGDDPPPASAARALRGLAATLGGTYLATTPTRLAEDLAAAMATLAHGGQVFDVRLAEGGRGAVAVDVPALSLGPTVATGVEVPAPKPHERWALSGRWSGTTVHGSVAPVDVPAAWLPPRPAREPARLAVTPGLVAYLEPVTLDPGPGPEPEVRGTMDRSVVRNALSLAYMPRARACYQTRPVRTPQMRDLSGRVRLEIDVIRGEVSRAAIPMTTLKQGDIERCLTEAAYALDMPRALRNDAPMTAVLNLIFQPRGGPPRPREPSPDPSADREIDMILDDGPASERDWSEILLVAPPAAPTRLPEGAAGAPTGAGSPAGAGGPTRLPGAAGMAPGTTPPEGTTVAPSGAPAPAPGPSVPQAPDPESPRPIEAPAAPAPKGRAKP